MKRLAAWGWRILLLLLVAVWWHNWQAVPSNHGYDNYGQALYVRKVVMEHYLPLANDGWSSYHPPLYFLIIGWLWRLLGQPALGPLKVGQLVSTLASMGLLGCTFCVASKLLPARREWVVLVLAALPVELTTAAMLHDSPLVGLLDGLFLLLLLRAWPRERLVLWEEIALGVVAGAAMLTRPESVVLVLLLGLLLLRRVTRGPGPLRREAALAFVAALLCVCAVSGWFFLRNIQAFGRPFVNNSDEECYPYWASDRNQLHGFRTLAFYLGGDLEMFSNPNFPSQTPWFIGTNYTASWWDHLGFFFGNLRPGKMTADALLLLGLVPTLLSIGGFYRVLRDPSRRTQWAPVLATGGAFAALFVTLNWVRPNFSTLKPVYLCGCYLPWAMLVGAGAEELGERWPRLLPWVEAAFAVLAALVACVFWYPG